MKTVIFMIGLTFELYALDVSKFKKKKLIEINKTVKVFLIVSSST